MYYLVILLKGNSSQNLYYLNVHNLFYYYNIVENILSKHI